MLVKKRRKKMYALILMHHRVPVEEVLKATDEHRAYLRKLKEEGTLIASGPTDPRTAGAILVRVPDDNVQQKLTELRNGDPFFKKNIANYELLVWDPVIGKEGLDKL
jgi:uncharacterized protein YciI